MSFPISYFCEPVGNHRPPQPPKAPNSYYLKMSFVPVILISKFQSHTVSVKRICLEILLFSFCTCLNPEVDIELEVAGGEGQEEDTANTLCEAERQV